MIVHYVKLAQKYFRKHRFYTLINTFGLVVGMLATLIIAKYLGGAWVRDSFHEKKDHIYSVTQEEWKDGAPQGSRASTYWGLAEIASQYADVLHVSRYGYHVGSLLIASPLNGPEVSFFEDKIFSVDSSFLRIFTFPLVHGSAVTALSKPGALLLTRSTAVRYFGDANPVGRVMVMRAPWGSESIHEVTGVLENPPSRSQFDFDVLVVGKPVEPQERWAVPDFSTFILVRPDARQKAVAEKLTNGLKSVPELLSTKRNVAIVLESLASPPLSSSEYLLGAVGVFIILISWVNYINQIIAQSYGRRREVGIRRVMGASRANLRLQFLVESTLSCMVAMILTLSIYWAGEPYLQSLTNGHVLPLWNDPTLLNTLFVSIYLVGILLAGAIPAVILFAPGTSSFLAHRQGSLIGNVGVRQSLVILQLAISTVLMVSVLVISHQLDYMRSKSKGVDLKDVLVLRAPIVKDTTWEVKKETVAQFKDKCKALPFVLAVSSSTSVPSEEYRQETFVSIANGSPHLVHQIGVDEHFFDLYQASFLSGRNFIERAAWKNRGSIILNESAANVLGIAYSDSLSNTRVTDHESNEVYDVVGVVKDFHQTSVKYRVRPIAFKYNTVRGHFSIRMNKPDLAEVDLKGRLQTIEHIWAESYPVAPFDYFFLDQKYADQDRADSNFGSLFQYFTGLSILISCLGLFGLSMLVSTKRQREIGIRKVFGATTFNILMNFLTGYLKPLVLAIAIGSPVAYFLMVSWLENYAYRANVGLVVFGQAWLSLGLIFTLVVTYHTAKASRVNPVEIIRE